MYIFKIAFLLLVENLALESPLIRKKPWKFGFGKNVNNGIKSLLHVVSEKAAVAQWRNGGLWNSGSIREEMRCWQGKGIRMTQGLHIIQGASLTLFHVMSGGAGFLSSSHSLTFLKFHFSCYFWLLDFFPLSCHFLVIKVFLLTFFPSHSPLPFSLSGKLAIYFSNSSERKPKGHPDKFI